MNPFLFGALEALRRRLARDQGRPPTTSEPLWRLLGEEAWLGLRWLVRRRTVRVGVPAILAGLLVVVGLSDATPGPVVGLGWRLAAAATSALAVVLLPRVQWHLRR